MKTVETLAVCKGFALCRGSITADDFYEYTYNDTSTDAKFSQIFFLEEGSGELQNSDGTVYGSSLVSGVWDLREFYKKIYRFVPYEKGAKWICINPIPSNKFFNIEHLKAGTERTIIGNDKLEIILCLRGSLNINDKVFNQYNYARILKGKEAIIKVNDDSEALYMYR